ncbi:hypothetical protein [Azospirillum largimobile]
MGGWTAIRGGGTSADRSRSRHTLYESPIIGIADQSLS